MNMNIINDVAFKTAWWKQKARMAYVAFAQTNIQRSSCELVHQSLPPAESDGCIPS